MGYRIETRTFEELEGKLKLPTFQRALVWSNNQKQEFFSTLKDGFPLVLFCYTNMKMIINTVLLMACKGILQW